MENNQTYKNRALASLEGKWSNGVIASLIVFALGGFASTVITYPMSEMAGLGVSSLWSVLCLPLSWGFVVYFLNLIRGLDISYERLFDGYKDFIRIFLAEFLVGMCVFIGSLLFIVPGIIIGIMLSQTTFILKDDPDISAADALRQSMDMTRGHKAQYFWLVLSFFGWFILALMTFGLGFLALIPYMYTTLAHYYEDLKAEQAE
ncbi:MAG: DUF975 family protein [Prevotella sp.]|nr:DUF975 family protein [Prevotella sp.]